MEEAVTTKNQKRYYVLISVFAIASFIATTFINLFLWQERHDLLLVTVYNLFVFVGIGVGGFICGILSDKFGMKLLYQIAMLAYAVELMLLVVLKHQVVYYLPLIGVITGLAIGCQGCAFATIGQLVADEGNKNTFLGMRMALTHIVIVIIVPVAAFVTQAINSFIPLFIAGITLFFFNSYFVTKLSLPQKVASRNLKKILSLLKQNQDMKRFFIAKILFGVQDGLFWMTMAIITLSFVGNLGRWGLFSSLISLLLILTVYLYGRMIRIRFELHTATLVTIIFAVASIFLAINWNITNFVYYQIAQVLLLVIMSVDFDSFFMSIIDEDPSITALRNEINGLTEIALNIGRVLPALLLLLFQVTTADSLVIRIAYIFVAFIPIQIIAILSRTKAVEAVEAIARQDPEVANLVK